jgi:hypothetical protein
MANKVMKYFGLPVPELHVAKWVSCPEEHLAISYVVNPTKELIYDIENDMMLNRIVNKEDFIGAYLCDCLLANADRRQFVICKTRAISRNVAFFGKISDSLTKTHCLVFIDNSLCFNSPLFDCKVMSPYTLKDLYRFCSDCDVESVASSWFTKMESITEQILLELFASVPPSWLDEGICIKTTADRIIQRKRQLNEAFEALCAIRRQPGDSRFSIPLSIPRRSVDRTKTFHLALSCRTA